MAQEADPPYQTPPMSDRKARWKVLLGELGRRKVFRTLGLYLAGAFVLLQAVDLFREAAFVPTWAFPLLLLLTVVGLPVTLVLSWAFDIGPHGIERTKDAGAEEVRVGLAARTSLVLVVTALSGLAGWGLWDDFAGTTGPAGGDDGASRDVVLRAGLDPLRIAVLYMDDHSPGGDLRYLADGLTEELLHDLAQVEALQVVSLNAVKAVRDGKISADSLIRQLKVGTYVEGSVTRSGDEVRVAAQLVDASTGVNLASYAVSRPMGDALALQDTLGQEISEALRRRLGIEIRQTTDRSAASNVEAWTLVQRAERLQDDVLDLYSAQPQTALAAVDRADSLLARAELLDPSWVEPPLRRGWLARLKGRYTAAVPGSDTEAELRRGLEFSERVLSEIPGYPRALELRGTLRAALAATLGGGAERDRLVVEAEDDLRGALQADPSLARGWWSLSELVRQQGRFQESIRLAERALREDAFLEEAKDVVKQLGQTAFEIEDLPRARRWCREGRRRYPEDSELALCELLFLASVDSIRPDVSAARSWADTVVLLAPAADTSIWRAYTDMQIAKVFARGGQPDSADAMIRRAHGDGFQLWLAYDEAHARLLMGQKDRALSLLEDYLTSRPDRKDYWPRDWWLRPLWNDPRFRAMTRQP